MRMGKLKRGEQRGLQRLIERVGALGPGSSIESLATACICISYVCETGEIPLCPSLVPRFTVSASFRADMLFSTVSQSTEHQGARRTSLLLAAAPVSLVVLEPRPPPYAAPFGANVYASCTPTYDHPPITVNFSVDRPRNRVRGERRIFGLWHNKCTE